jgi:hypothetical protein
MSSGVFVHATSGWRRIVPVEEQGASSSTASKASSRVEVEEIADLEGDINAEPFQIRLEPARARDGFLDRRNPGPAMASCAVLPPGARTEIRDAQPCHVTEQPRRQAGGRILYPPGAFLEAGERRNRRREPRHADRAGGQYNAAQLFRPIPRDRRAR